MAFAAPKLPARGRRSRVAPQVSGNEATLHQLYDNALFQQLQQDPGPILGILQNDPVLQQAAQSDPQLAALLDPSMLSRVLASVQQGGSSSNDQQEMLNALSRNRKALAQLQNYAQQLRQEGSRRVQQPMAPSSDTPDNGCPDQEKGPAVAAAGPPPITDRWELLRQRMYKYNERGMILAGTKPLAPPVLAPKALAAHMVVESSHQQQQEGGSLQLPRAVATALPCPKPGHSALVQVRSPVSSPGTPAAGFAAKAGPGAAKSCRTDSSRSRRVQHGTPFTGSPVGPSRDQQQEQRWGADELVPGGPLSPASWAGSSATASGVGRLYPGAAGQCPLLPADAFSRAIGSSSSGSSRAASGPEGLSLDLLELLSAVPGGGAGARAGASTPGGAASAPLLGSATTITLTAAAAEAAVPPTPLAEGSRGGWGWGSWLDSALGLVGSGGSGGSASSSGAPQQLLLLPGSGSGGLEGLGGGRGQPRAVAASTHKILRPYSSSPVSGEVATAAPAAQGKSSSCPRAWPDAATSAAAEAGGAVGGRGEVVEVGAGLSADDVRRRLASGDVVVEIEPPTKLATTLSWSTSPTAEYVLEAASLEALPGPALLAASRDSWSSSVGAAGASGPTLRLSIPEMELWVVEGVLDSTGGPAGSPAWSGDGVLPQRGSSTTSTLSPLEASPHDASRGGRWGEKPLGAPGAGPASVGSVGGSSTASTMRARRQAGGAVTGAGPGIGSPDSCKSSSRDGSGARAGPAGVGLRGQAAAGVPGSCRAAAVAVRNGGLGLQGELASQGQEGTDSVGNGASREAAYYRMIMQQQHGAPGGLGLEGQGSGAQGLKGDGMDPKTYYEDVAPSSWRPDGGDSCVSLYRRAYCTHGDALFPPLWLATACVLAASGLLPFSLLLLAVVAAFPLLLLLLAVKGAGVRPLELPFSRVVPSLVVSAEVLNLAMLGHSILPAAWLGHAGVSLSLAVALVAAVFFHLRTYLLDPGYVPLPESDLKETSRRDVVSGPPGRQQQQEQQRGGGAGCNKACGVGRGCEAPAGSSTFSSSSAAGRLDLSPLVEFSGAAASIEIVPLGPSSSSGSNSNSPDKRSTIRGRREQQQQAAAASRARRKGCGGSVDQGAGTAAGRLQPGAGLRGVNACWTCGVDRPLRSKHCPFCRRCVERLDHHCHVVGTCIGRGNQRSFTCYLLALLAGQLLYLYLVPALLLQECSNAPSHCYAAAAAPSGAEAGLHKLWDESGASLAAGAGEGAGLAAAVASEGSGSSSSSSVFQGPLLLVSALWYGRLTHPGWMLMLLFHVLTITASLSITLRHLMAIAANLTVNEWVNRHRYIHLQHERGGYCNRLDRGPLHNCWEFWGAHGGDPWEAWEEGEAALLAFGQPVVSLWSAATFIRWWDSAHARFRARLLETRRQRAEVQLERRLRALKLTGCQEEAG